MCPPMSDDCYSKCALGCFFQRPYLRADTAAGAKTPNLALQTGAIKEYEMKFVGAICNSGWLKCRIWGIYSVLTRHWVIGYLELN